MLQKVSCVVEVARVAGTILFINSCFKGYVRSALQLERFVSLQTYLNALLMVLLLITFNFDDDRGV